MAKKVPKKDYWIARAERTLVAGEKSALAYEKTLTKAYKKTQQAIKTEIEAFYGRYATEQGISLADAKKRLDKKNLRQFRDEADTYLAEVDAKASDMNTSYRKQLKALSGKAYISRLEELKTKIQQKVEVLAADYDKGLTGVLKKGYNDGYHRTMFDVSKQAGFGIDFTSPGGTLLDTAVKEKWLGDNYSGRIWADKQKLVNNLEQILSQAFVRNQGSNALAKELTRRLDVSLSNAKRLIRTEINHISNKGTMAAYKDSGVVDKYEYLATLDSRTSEICIDLDGNIIPVSEGIEGINIPPLHPYCRSTTIPSFEDDEISSAVVERVARDGKSYTLPSDMKYKDWVAKHASTEYRKTVAKTPEEYVAIDTAKDLSLSDKVILAKEAYESKKYETEVELAKGDYFKAEYKKAKAEGTATKEELRKTYALMEESMSKSYDLINDTDKLKKELDKLQAELDFTKSQTSGGSSEVIKTLLRHEDHIKEWYETRIVGTSDKALHKEFNKALKDFIDANDLAMRIPNEDVLDAILKTGFKTQFETNTSNGALNSMARREATMQLFGTTKEDLNFFENSDYEKYGYLASKNVKKDFSLSNDADQYGAITIRFKKEAVADRTTITLDDSLGSARNGRIVATPVTNPTIASMKTTRISDSSIKEHIKQLQTLTDDPVNAGERLGISYFELQYHGKLDASAIESVAYEEKYYKLSDTIKVKLEMLGIQVIEVKE